MSKPPIRAELFGSDRCTALGITTQSHAPVLDMCRKLIVAGYDPATPMHVYRGDTLALRVRSLGDGAELAITTAPNGALIWRTEMYAEAPPVQFSEPEAPEPTLASSDA